MNSSIDTSSLEEMKSYWSHAHGSCLPPLVPASTFTVSSTECFQNIAITPTIALAIALRILTSQNTTAVSISSSLSYQAFQASWQIYPAAFF